MNQSTTINIPFQVNIARSNTSTPNFAYIDHENINSHLYIRGEGVLTSTEKAKLRQTAREQIDQALKQVAEYRQHFIGCNDGTVLLVQFRHGHWGYVIAGFGRASSTSGMETYESAVESALYHAKQAYGGINWEC